jgi:hypothetical protein
LREHDGSCPDIGTLAAELTFLGRGAAYLGEQLPDIGHQEGQLLV